MSDPITDLLETIHAGQQYSKADIIQRFCKLQSTVRSAFNLPYPSDGFCHCNSLPPDLYRNNGESLRLIEKIVARAINDRDETLKWLEAPDAQ